MKKNKEKILNLILPIVSILAIALIWAVMALKVDSEFILPSIQKTAKEFVALFDSKEFYLSLFFTLFRSVVSFLVSFVVAFALAVCSVKVKYFRGIISPIVSIMRALPTIAIVLLLLFWTNSKVAPIMVTIIVVLPTLYTHIESALFSLEKSISEAGRVDGADEKSVFLNVELPQIMPTVYSGIGSGISLNLKLMVAAEVIAQTAKSIGYLLNTSKVYFEIAQMIAIVCAVVILGLVIESVFNYLSKKSGEWK